MASEQCVHGNRPVRNICFYAQCKLPAFVCMACEECLTLHQHNGGTTLRNLKTIAQSIQALSSKAPAGPKAEHIRNTAGQMIGRLSGIARRIEGDFQELTKKLELRPDIANLISRLRTHDTSLTGRQVHYLTEAIKLKKVYLDPEVIEEKTTELEGVYQDFMHSLSQLVSQFNSTRASIMDGSSPKPALPSNSRQKTHNDALKAMPVSSRRLQQEADRKPQSPSRVVEPPVSRQFTPQSPQQPETEVFIKISDIKPNLKQFNIIAKIMNAHAQIYSNGTFVKCVLGDQSGTVKATFRESEEICKGAVLKFKDLKAELQNGRLSVSDFANQKIENTSRKLDHINEKNNISDKNHNAL